MKSYTLTYKNLEPTFGAPLLHKTVIGDDFAYGKELFTIYKNTQEVFVVVSQLFISMDITEIEDAT